jgi:hypothetical protein
MSAPACLNYLGTRLRLLARQIFNFLGQCLLSDVLEKNGPSSSCLALYRCIITSWPSDMSISSAIQQLHSGTPFARLFSRAAYYFFSLFS